jgi:hypothetical protein
MFATTSDRAFRLFLSPNLDWRLKTLRHDSLEEATERSDKMSLASANASLPGSSLARRSFSISS